MTIQAIQPEGVTTAAPFYSPAILAKGQQVLFISGQGPKNYEADIKTQIRDHFQTGRVKSGGTQIHGQLCLLLQQQNGNIPLRQVQGHQRAHRA